MSLVQTFSRLRLVTADALRPRGGAAGELPVERGQVHEFSGTAGVAPLTVMLGLACRRLRARERVVFVGRRCWPTFPVVGAMLAQANAKCKMQNAKREMREGVRSMHDAGKELGRCWFLDPASARERFWAVGEALRCPAIGAVLADGEGLDAATSRRLQLAAEARGEDGAVALLAREEGGASWAAGRWRVRAVNDEGNLEVQNLEDKNSFFRGQREAWAGNKPRLPRGARGREEFLLDSLSPRMNWELTLVSGRQGGGTGAEAPRRWIFSWTYQVFRGTGAVDLSAAVGHSTAQTPVAQTA
jgi:hypothetical protein